jgi:hypothetical protein
MATLADIAQHVNDVLFEYFMSDDSIICDNGTNNVHMKNGFPLQYDFSDTEDNPKSRSDIEEEKIKLLNHIMKIMMDIQRFVCLYGPIDNPRDYKGCDDFTCAPGCGCGAWDIDRGCGNVPDTIHGVAKQMQSSIKQTEQTIEEQIEGMDIQ